MSDKKRCLLSVAMIMKNEEHNLDRALGSIKPYVDEIIVVDTGSSDNSVEVAKKYTDKIYFHEWKDDFSEARNYSLQFPTCEWVLIYDADEEVREDFAGIREFLEKLPRDVNTVYLPTISYLDWDLKKTEVASTPRLFKNGTVYYKNIVHNQPIYKGRVIEAPFPIYHYGYIWTRKLKKKKYERTRNLIVKLLEESKGLSEVERFYYLCQLYKTELIGGNLIEAHSVVRDILKVVDTSSNITSIAFEVLFLHSMELIQKGFKDQARHILNQLARAVPKYPDPYYGLLVIEELEDNHDKMIEYGHKFIENLEYVERNPQEFGWTIISIKYKMVGHLLLAIAYLKKGDISSFKKHFYMVFDSKVLTTDEVIKFSNVLLNRMLELKDEVFEKLLNEVLVLLNRLYELNQNVNVLEIVDRILELKVEFDTSLLTRFLENDRFGKLVLQKINENKDGLVEYIFGSEVDEWVRKIEETGTEGLLFFYEQFPNDNPLKLKLLNKLRMSENNVIKGIAHSLIGDIYLEKANYKLALEYYRKSIEILPELSRFVKPILDDLKTRLDPTIDGIFAELKSFYLSNKEMLVDILKEFPRQELEKLYLISGNDYAKYIAAITLRDSKKEKAIKLLESIRDWEEFPFIEYRYAKLFENSKVQSELKKAFEYHLKALKKTTTLGDIALGIFKFDNFYPCEDFPKTEDEIVWVGNISEKQSGLGVISPLRIWRKSEQYYYVDPFHTDEAIRVYKEKVKGYKLPLLTIGKQEILRVIEDVNFQTVKVLETDKNYEDLVKNVCTELGIQYSQNSKNMITFELINTAKDFLELVKNFESGILFYYVPDFDNHDDMVWYYPIFRFIRTKKQVEEELKKSGAKSFKHYVLNSSLRAVVYEK